MEKENINLKSREVALEAYNEVKEQTAARMRIIFRTLPT